MQFGSSLILWRCLVFEDTVLSEIYLSKLLKRCRVLQVRRVAIQLAKEMLNMKWMISVYDKRHPINPADWFQCKLFVRALLCSWHNVWHKDLGESQNCSFRTASWKIIRTPISIWKKKTFCISDLRIPPCPCRASAAAALAEASKTLRSGELVAKAVTESMGGAGKALLLWTAWTMLWDHSSHSCRQMRHHGVIRVCF